MYHYNYISCDCCILPPTFVKLRKLHPANPNFHLPYNQAWDFSGFSRNSVCFLSVIKDFFPKIWFSAYFFSGQSHACLLCFQFSMISLVLVCHNIWNNLLCVHFCAIEEVCCDFYMCVTKESLCWLCRELMVLLFWDDAGLKLMMFLMCWL